MARVEAGLGGTQDSRASKEVWKRWPSLSLIGYQSINVASPITAVSILDAAPLADLACPPETREQNVEGRVSGSCSRKWPGKALQEAGCQVKRAGKAELSGATIA